MPVSPDFLGCLPTCTGVTPSLLRGSQQISLVCHFTARLSWQCVLSINGDWKNSQHNAAIGHRCSNNERRSMWVLTYCKNSEYHPEFFSQSLQEPVMKARKGAENTMARRVFQCQRAKSEKGRKPHPRKQILGWKLRQEDIKIGQQEQWDPSLPLGGSFSKNLSTHVWSNKDWKQIGELVNFTKQWPIF